MVSASAKSRLPTGFREVQWLQGSGTQYCVTDIYPVYDANNFTEIRGDFTALDAQNSRFEIGTDWYVSSYGYRYSCTFSYTQSLPSGVFEPKLIFAFGRTGNNNATVSMANFVYPLDVHYELNRTTLVHNGGTSTRTSPSTVTYSSTRPLIIGGSYASGGVVNVFNTQTRYKSIKIYNSNTLLYEFVPCYRKSDGKTGFMKITVADGSTEFFPNMGTDEWIIGPVV